MTRSSPWCRLLGRQLISLNKQKWDRPRPSFTTRHFSLDEERGFDIPLSHQKTWFVNKKLFPNVLNLTSSEDGEIPCHTGLSVCFLGTGAGQPSQFRGASGTALRFHEGIYLFDVGEGVQLKAQVSRLSLSKIDKIFITHMHGDHVFGIPSLLLSIQSAVQFHKTNRTIKVYGPVGLYNYIATALSLSFAEIKNLNVEVYELHGGTRRWIHPGTSKNFSDFRHRSLHRKFISPNQDGTWTLEKANEIQTPDDAEVRSKPTGFNVYAAQVNHVPNLQCFGYMVEEPIQPRFIDAKKTAELGVAPGDKYKVLKAGFPVMTDDGKAEVHPDEVTRPGNPPRKVVFLGDCDGIPVPMASLCRDADVMVHEATLLESQIERTDTRGHSTAAMAGLFAEYVGARVLALNHISPSISVALKMEKELVKEARSMIKGSTEVQLAYDQMEIMIPRAGFTEEELSKTP